jgi:hypothetical protein
MIEHYKYYLLRETSRIYKKNKDDSKNNVFNNTITDLLSDPIKFGYSLREACSRAHEILLTVKSNSPVMNYDDFLSASRIQKIDRINNPEPKHGL